jgi:hypothetical protein
LSFDFDAVESQDLARIKTMLSLASNSKEAACGEALWNDIYHLVSIKDSRAGTFTFNELPAGLKSKCVGLASQFDGGAVQRLREHAGGVLRRIRTSIHGMAPLSRNEPMRRLAEAITNHQFVIVVGPPGASKSALSRTTFEQFFREAPLFAFQANEFARTHLDQVLAELRLSIRISELSALFSLHREKCMLIDSVERLLEAEPRDAFFMLLDELATDPTWRVVFTCRQYSIKQVEEIFFKRSGLSPAIIDVPLLDDGELDTVAQAIPKIGPLLKSPRTRKLLRNPFFLDKAASVNWKNEDLQQALSEKMLRDTLWFQVIRREDIRHDGLPLKRERCFRSVALRRAKTMLPFVQIEHGHEEAAQSLLNDELLIQNTDSSGVAAAHDILEDWALVREVRMKYDETAGQPKAFFIALGYELSMRRCYRQWLHESLEEDITDVPFRFATEVMRSSDIEPYWQDETIVSLMLSENADQFITSEENALLADDKRLFRRIVHILRVACKKPNPLVPDIGASTSGETHNIFLVPQGPGWEAVLHLIQRNLEIFTSADFEVILGLLKDWRSSVQVGQVSVAARRTGGLIALHFWQLIKKTYTAQDDVTALASAVLAAPESIQAELEKLISDITISGSDHENSLFAGRLLASFDGINSCFALPTLVAKFTKHAWGIDRSENDRCEEDLRRRPHLLDSDLRFGLHNKFHLRLNPASGINGPFCWLLRRHPDIGKRLILDITNAACERAVLDSPHTLDNAELSVDLSFGEGITARQWANDTFWRMYRQPGLGPDLITCGLMALEKWLLERCENGDDLRKECRELLISSNNVAITAVIASIAVAHPERLGEVVLILLKTPHFFRWDQIRLAAEQVPKNVLLEGMPMPVEHRIYDEERKISAKLPHRNRCLEWLMTALQLTELRPSVEDIIDNHRVLLPSEKNQDDAIRLWRLVLHRTDLRRHTTEKDPVSGHTVFTPNAPEPDLQKLVAERAPVVAAWQEQERLLKWGTSCLNGDNENNDPSQWTEMLISAQKLVSALDEKVGAHDRLMVQGAGSYIASVCVRDHWKYMTPEQRTWCRSLLLEAVIDDLENRNIFGDSASLPMHGSKPAALTLPLLLGSDIEEENRIVRVAIATAVTHASEEFRNFAVNGVVHHLWACEPQTAWACAFLLVRWSKLREQCYIEEQKKPWDQRRDYLELEQNLLQELRPSIAGNGPLNLDYILTLELSSSFSLGVLPHVLFILSEQTDSELSLNFHQHVARGLSGMWESSKRDQRNYSIEIAIKKHLAYFCLRTSPLKAESIFEPIIAATTSHPEEVAECLEQLIIAENRLGSRSTFWGLWQRIADAFTTEDQLKKLLAKHVGSGLTKLVETLFLQTVEWKIGVDYWAPLDSQAATLGLLQHFQLYSDLLVPSCFYRMR